VGCRAYPLRGTRKRRGRQEESMKVPEADRRASGEATAPRFQGLLNKKADIHEQEAFKKSSR